MMKLYNVNPDYIDYIRKNNPNVRESKFSISQTGGRKYIGVALQSGDFYYYIPISSSSHKDYYIDADGNTKAKKDQLFSLYVKETKLNPNIEIITNVLKLGNAIPIPQNQLIPFNVNIVKNYPEKKRYLELIKYINRNEQYIKKSLKKVLSLPEKSKVINYFQVKKDLGKFTRNIIIDDIQNNLSVLNKEFYYQDKLYEIIKHKAGIKEFRAIEKKNSKNINSDNTFIFLLNSSNQLSKECSLTQFMQWMAEDNNTKIYNELRKKQQSNDLTSLTTNELLFYSEIDKTIKNYTIKSFNFDENKINVVVKEPNVENKTFTLNDVGLNDSKLFFKGITPNESTVEKQKLVKNDNVME